MPVWPGKLFSFFRTAQAFTFLWLFLGAAWAVPAHATDYYQVANGANVNITAFSTCRNVANGHASGSGLFVPTKTSPEWTAFYQNPPSGVTVGACGPVNDGTSSATPGLSCQDILDSGYSTGNGTYWIDPTNSGSAYQAYCDMTTNGGGWTLVLKSVVDNSDFTYGSSIWASGATQNTSDFTLWGGSNALYQSYNEVVGDDILIKFETQGSIELDAVSSNKTAKFYATNHITNGSSTASCKSWGASIPLDASWIMQGGSMEKGTNLNASATARFGVISDNDLPALGSTMWDSAVGVGISGPAGGKGSGNVYWGESACANYGSNSSGTAFYKAHVYIRGGSGSGSGGGGGGPAVLAGSATSDTPGTINLPSGIAAGDLLLIGYTAGGDDSVGTPSGFTQIASVQSGAGGTDRWLQIFKKTATGSEGSSISISPASGGGQSAMALRITGWSSVAVSTGAGGSGVANTDNISLGSSANTLLISMIAHRATVGAAPSGYAGLVTAANSNVYTSFAYKSAVVSSEDPGAFSIGTDNWAGVTIGVR